MAGDEVTNGQLSTELLASVGELASELNRKQAAAIAVSALPSVVLTSSGQESKELSITTPSSAKSQEIRRVMRPITDTRLSRMGQPVVRTAQESAPQSTVSQTRHVSAPPPISVPHVSASAETAPSPEPQRPLFATLPKIPAQLARGASEAAPPPAPAPGTRAFLLGADHDARSFVTESLASVSAGPAKAPPPPLAAPAAPAGASIDDITAALLRPMLKRWVEDNMQALVTRALFREAASKPGKSGA